MSADVHLIVGGAAVLVAVGAVAIALSPASAASPPAGGDVGPTPRPPSTPLDPAGMGPDDPRLGADRRTAVAALRAVLPAYYPDARWKKILPGFDPSDPSLPPHFTTCGALPPVVGHALGVANGITRYGVPGVQTEAEAYGAWVDAKAATAAGRRPLPGDFFLLGNGKGMIYHTGVLYDTRGAVWTTGDAGQGSAASPAALYVKRPWDPQTRVLGTTGRILVGWLDLDAYMREYRRRQQDPSRRKHLDSGRRSVVASWMHFVQEGTLPA